MNTVLAFLCGLAILIFALMLHEMGHFFVNLVLRIPMKSLWLGFPIRRRKRKGEKEGKLILYLKTKFWDHDLYVTPLLIGAGVEIEEDVWWTLPYWKKVLSALAGPLFTLGFMIAFCMLRFGSDFGWYLSSTVIQASGIATVDLVSGKIPLSQLSGIVGLLDMFTKFISIDPLKGPILAFILMSAGLFAVNLLPIPALDGGHLTTGALVKLGIKVKYAKILNYVCFLSLVVFLIYLTAKDFYNILF